MNPKTTLAALVIISGLAGCVATQPATDSSSPVSPSGTTTTPPTTTTPTSPTTTTSPPAALAYTPDMAPIFASDCTPCHSGSRPSGNYSMSTYANVMRDVTPGSASSRLVIWTQPSGSMYRYFSVDRAGRSAMVKRWVVDDKAAQTR